MRKLRFRYVSTFQPGNSHVQPVVQVPEIGTIIKKNYEIDDLTMVFSDLLDNGYLKYNI